MKRATSTQAQRDQAVAFTRAAMAPITLCDKVGVASGRIFLCRYRAGHGGTHYFEAHGAVEVLPTPAWVKPHPYVSDALPPWYDDDIPGYVDDLVLPDGEVS